MFRWSSRWIPRPLFSSHFISSREWEWACEWTAKTEEMSNHFAHPAAETKTATHRTPSQIHCLVQNRCFRFLASASPFAAPLMWQQKQIHRKTVEPATCWSQGMGRHMGKGKTAKSIVQAALFDAQQSHCVGGLEMRQLQAKWERFFNISYSHIYKYPSSPESIWIRVPILKRYCAPIHLIIYAMAIEM